MSLSDLEERLHTREGATDRPILESGKFNPNRVSSDAASQLSQTSAWHEKHEPFFVKYRREVGWGAIAIGIIASLMVLVGVFVRIQQSLFSENRVEVTVSGPDNVNSSDSVTFVVSYKNANRISLSNAEVVVSYPPNFRPEGNENIFRDDVSSSIVSVGDLPAFGTGSFNFSGKFFGSKNSIAYIDAELRYHPKNLETRLSVNMKKSVNLRTASIAVELEAPLTVSPGGESTYLVNYENLSETALSNVRLKVSYPTGFSFVEGDPNPSEGESVWYLGTVGSSESGKIRITGKQDGVPNESKLFRAELGTFQGDNTFLAYSDVERTTRVVAPPFGIQQSLNGTKSPFAVPGEILRYTVQYRNNLEIALREVIVSVDIEGEALDFSRLRSEGGAYDSTLHRIVWKASDSKDLANLVPNASGEVSFSVPVRDDFVPESPITKNFQVKTTAKVESPDVPNPAGANKLISTETMWVKVNSRLVLETFGRYSGGAIANTGPIPPIVGEETTYTINWQLSNTTNDVKDVEVWSDIPTGARWTGKIFPETETISYNERTNRVVWSVGNLGVGEGLLSPKREVSFQLAIRPEVNQVDEEVSLLGISSAKATDVFTGEIIRVENREKTTVLIEDRDVGGRVRSR